MRRKRLHWYVHVCWREKQEDIRKTFELDVSGQRRRGRLKHTLEGHFGSRPAVVWPQKQKTFKSALEEPSVKRNPAEARHLKGYRRRKVGKGEYTSYHFIQVSKDKECFVVVFFFILGGVVVFFILGV